jgi:hypothetical protein
MVVIRLSVISKMKVNTPQKLIPKKGADPVKNKVFFNIRVDNQREIDRKGGSSMYSQERFIQ